MTILEIMERTGARDPNLVRAWINDALEDIQDLIPDKTTWQKINVVADTRFYTLPSDMIELLGVYRRFDSQGRYIRIGRVQSLDIDEPTTSVSASTNVGVADIVVVR
jgi:hypothetical protein